MLKKFAWNEKHSKYDEFDLACLVGTLTNALTDDTGTLDIIWEDEFETSGYYKVWGSFMDSDILVIKKVSPIVDHNEITHHILQCIHEFILHTPKTKHIVKKVVEKVAIKKKGEKKAVQTEIDKLKKLIPKKTKSDKDLNSRKKGRNKHIDIELPSDESFLLTLLPNK